MRPITKPYLISLIASQQRSAWTLQLSQRAGVRCFVGNIPTCRVSCPLQQNQPASYSICLAVHAECERRSLTVSFQGAASSFAILDWMASTPGMYTKGLL